MFYSEVLPALAKGIRNTFLALIPVIIAIGVLGYLFLATPSNGQELVHLQPELCEGGPCEIMDYIPTVADSALVLVCFGDRNLAGYHEICAHPLPSSEANTLAELRQDWNPQLLVEGTIEYHIQFEWMLFGKSGVGQIAHI